MLNKADKEVMEILNNKYKITAKWQLKRGNLLSFRLINPDVNS